MPLFTDKQLSMCGCSGYTWSDDGVFQQLAANVEQSRAVGARTTHIRHSLQLAPLRCLSSVLPCLLHCGANLHCCSHAIQCAGAMLSLSLHSMCSDFWPLICGLSSCLPCRMLRPSLRQESCRASLAPSRVVCLSRAGLLPTPSSACSIKCTWLSGPGAARLQRWALAASTWSEWLSRRGPLWTTQHGSPTTWRRPGAGPRKLLHSRLQVTVLGQGMVCSSCMHLGGVAMLAVGCIRLVHACTGGADACCGMHPGWCLLALALLMPVVAVTSTTDLSTPLFVLACSTRE